MTQRQVRSAERDGARVALDQLQYGKDVGSASIVKDAAWTLNQVEIMAGRIEAARRRLDELLAQPAASALEGLAAFGQLLVLADLTDPPAMTDLWLQTDAAHNPIVFIFPWQAANHAWAGQRDQALAALAAWRENTRPLCPGFIRGYTDTWAARVAWWSSDSDTARFLYDALLPFRNTWAYAQGAAITPVSIALGQCAHLQGDLDLAVEHFDAALADATGEGYALAQIEGHLYAAATLASLDRIEEARRHDAAGRELARQCGATAFLERRAFAPYFDPNRE